MKSLAIAVISLVFGVALGYKLNGSITRMLSKAGLSSLKPDVWSQDYVVVKVKSSLDGTDQNVYSYRTTSASPQPLVVSLHSWSGDYQQDDLFHDRVRDRNWNYIHPDYRGANNNKMACASVFALADIDDAIDYALKNFNCDSSKIYVVGGSGGGHAALAMYLRSRHKIKQYSVWCPITDLEIWYTQCPAEYKESISKCMNLDRSPIKWAYSSKGTRLDLYAGINDEVVPYSQCVNFYTKITGKNIGELNKDSKELIAGKKLLLYDSCGSTSITLFEGGHEILPGYVVRSLD